MIKSNISFKTILATLAVTVALAGCAKELIPGKVDTDPEATVLEGSRVITVSFDTPTRTYLDTLRPKFKDGDLILLATKLEDIDSPLDTETVAVTVKEKKATITTKLSGNLIAFYPAKYVRIDKKPAFLFSAVQTGEFEDANLCEALIDADNQVAQFTNASALFSIYLPQGTTKLTIRSLPGIGVDGQRTGDVAPINNEGKSKAESYVITVGDGTKTFDKRYCYVSLMPGVQLRNLSFEASVDASTGFIKGIPVDEKLQDAMARDTDSNDDRIDKGWSYWIGDENWHEYVTVAGRKWATMNLGAESPEDPGEYFMWGEVKGHKFSVTDSTFTDDFNAFDFSDPRYTNSSIDPAACFDERNAPYTGIDGGYEGILKLVDDAANVNWGGAWRIPTKKEFEELVGDSTKTRADSCYKFGANQELSFFFSGRVTYDNANKLQSFGQLVNFWSSTLVDNNLSLAYALLLVNDGYATASDFSRRTGSQIRAIIDEPVIEEEKKK